MDLKETIVSPGADSGHLTSAIYLLTLIKPNTMQLRKNIAMSESGFIFNPATGDSFSVNTIGLKILELLKKGHSEASIQNELLKLYDVEKDRLEEDFYDFTSHLRQLSLLLNEKD